MLAQEQLADCLRSNDYSVTLTAWLFAYCSEYTLKVLADKGLSKFLGKMKTSNLHFAFLVIVDLSQASFSDIILEDKIGFGIL